MTKVLYERTTAQPQSLAAHSRDMAAILQALGDPARAAPPPGRGKDSEAAGGPEAHRPPTGPHDRFRAARAASEADPMTEAEDDEILTIEDVNAMIPRRPLYPGPSPTCHPLGIGG